MAPAVLHAHIWNGVIDATPLTVGERGGPNSEFTSMGETVNHDHAGVRIGCLVCFPCGRAHTALIIKDLCMALKIVRH